MTKRDLFLLQNDDRILWENVARTVTPLKGKHLPVAEAGKPETTPLAGQDGGSFADLVSVPQRPGPQPEPKHPSTRLDRPTKEKLAKGRLALEARVDLHGLTQSEAHMLLLSFLHRAHTAGIRHVLVITGKGSSLGSDGILRKAVPNWFATPAFCTLVGGYESAGRQHGGSGAIYVRLRRPQE